MKKIVIGVCGVLVFLGGLAGIRSGELKAGERTEASSSIGETGTSDVSVPESEGPAVEEVPPVAPAVAPSGEEHSDEEMERSIAS